MKLRYILQFCFGTLLFSTGCRKALQIQPPIGTIVAANVFSTDQQATSAADAMYFAMVNGNGPIFSNCAMSIYAGMSADELIPSDQNYSDGEAQFQQDNLQVTNSVVNSGFWSPAYSVMYQANSVLEGLDASSGVHDSVKNELIGEAEFVRAFCNFYLVNLFGGIPLVTSTDYKNNGNLSKSSAQDVYQQILFDLNDAKQRLAADFSVGQGQRIIPNKWAVEALLARVYLFTGDWPNAKVYADSVIGNTSLFSLVSDPNQVFIANSKEAIWQMQQSNQTAPNFNVTNEGALLIPFTLNSDFDPPYTYLTVSLLNAFESGDLRRQDWVDSTLYQGVTYYFPYKYKQGPAAISAGASCIEYYMVLRLAEQFLIRAEAEARLNNSAAISDLNAIRSRSNLPAYSGSTSQDSVLAAIQHERQIELFAEWGNRWLDLKRTTTATTILSQEKGFQVSMNSLVYPIPSSELQVAPNLHQNPGY